MATKRVDDLVLRAAVQARESVNLLGELLTQCNEGTSDAEVTNIGILSEGLHLMLLAGQVELAREKVLVALLAVLNAELESLIGHATMTASQMNE
jgi:hypothetical protein